MPRVSREQADLNRAAIEHAASMLFREKGINGVSVADLMSAAGLTHGGFYGHFSSKDELAASACAHAFGQSLQRWERRVAGRCDEDARTALIDAYLSRKQLRDIGNACAALTLASDVAREPADKPVHDAYQAGVAGLLEVLTAVSPADKPQERRKQALVQLSTMVGAMSLARAVQDEALADELIAAAREHLLHGMDADTASP